MTQEDKELLLKDLCGRLPYGVKVLRLDFNKVKEIQYIEPLNSRVKLLGDPPGSTTDIEDVIPYLRPISSMTKEEKDEFEDIIGFKVWSDDFDNEFDFMSNEYSYIDKECVVNTFNWLNAHHFDYRDMISRGLAIEAKGKNNPYKV
jgi:hypothetical protein